MKRFLKNVITAYVLLIFLNIEAQNDVKKYKVVGIDSTENNYLIDIKKGDTTSLIVSSKINGTNKEGKRIKLGKRYCFNLTEFKLKYQELDAEIEKSLTIDSKTVLKDGVKKDIYFTNNLVGLNYIKNPN